MGLAGWHAPVSALAFSSLPLLQALCRFPPAFPAGARRVRLLQSPAHRWLPLLLLAALAACDFAAQAVLPAVSAAAAAGRLPIAQGVLDFIHSVVGLSQEARGLELALRLLRPVALLLALAFFRSAFCLGSLHRQLQRESLSPATLDALRWGRPAA